MNKLQQTVSQQVASNPEQADRPAQREGGKARRIPAKPMINKKNSKQDPQPKHRLHEKQQKQQTKVSSQNIVCMSSTQKRKSNPTCQSTASAHVPLLKNPRALHP